ncbi:MAG: ATP-binding protein [Vicinamibacterales bacterium]
MRFAVRRIAVRFALILAGAAVMPLLAYGLVSLLSLQRGTRETVIVGNQNVAGRAAEEISRYVAGHAEILRALGADLQDTELQPWQQDRIVKNYILQFREFREITLFDVDGRTVATSRIGATRLQVPTGPTVSIGGARMTPVAFDEDQLPTATFAIPLRRLNQPAGWLVGQISLEEMWRMVDRIRIGTSGHAMVVSADGTLMAHGDPDEKPQVAQARRESRHPLLQVNAPDWAEYTRESGRTLLSVASAIPTLGWTVLVEQPTREAFATARALQQQLIVAIALALLTMVFVGLVFGRRFIAPIFALQAGTQQVAEGKFDSRVEITTGDEFQDLGQSFNTMADKLVELQEEVKRQERQAMFGRIAAGLVHDLSHPIQNIGNSTRLLLREDLDSESRDMFRKTIERELSTLKRFMEDLRNIVKPRPIEKFALDMNTSVSETVDAMRAEGERAGLVVETRYADGPLTVVGDRFALGRVYRNLITNAIQATAPGGRVVITTARSGGQVQVVVSDTGAGIPEDRLGTIFEEFVTTKRRGLGLGLAICRRIVEQLDGTIEVQSEVGVGTTFTLRFPAHESQVQAAS